MPDVYDSVTEKLLDAALNHVAFDGWSDATFRAAVSESGVDEAAAKVACPRGAVDLAIAFHKRGDAAMEDRFKREDLSELRYSEKVAAAIRFRLEAVTDKEAVRRGTTLFSLPIYAADGAKLIWGTADKVWTLLGDRSDDFNWYSKRATLSGVYGSTVLFWLGDDSPDHSATWAFLDRRIEDVMRIEKLKSQVRNAPVLGRLMAGPDWLMSQIKAPIRVPDVNLPGSWTTPRD